MQSLSIYKMKIRHKHIQTGLLWFYNTHISQCILSLCIFTLTLSKKRDGVCVSS